MVPRNVLSSCCKEHREFSEVLESKSFSQLRRSNILVATAARKNQQQRAEGERGEGLGTEIMQARTLHRAATLY